KNNENNSLMMIVKETVVLILLLLFFFFLKSNTIELFKIPTGSMEPTLYGANDMGKGFGDHLFVLRGAYGLSSRIKVPFVNWRIPLPDYRIMLPGMSLPKVGDVVVFENPTNTKIDYIKRCAGAPGDKIKIRKGKLYVNDKIFTNSPAQAQYVHYTNEGLLGDKFNVVESQIKQIALTTLFAIAKTNQLVKNELITKITNQTGNSRKAKIILNQFMNPSFSGQNQESRVTMQRLLPTFEKYIKLKKIDKIKDCILINGKPYREVEKEILNRTSTINPIFDNIVSEVIVPTNSFFMLGDNSAHSADSRYWGFAPLDFIKGRAWCVYLPIKRAKMIR
ncbi:MAG: signal peptidase I, partial [Alphaproteobacteria bacterium]